LVTRDPLLVCRTLMILSGGAAAAELDLDAFLRQADDFKEPEGALGWISRWRLELGVTHPLSVRRVHELMNWVREGHYDRIIGGEYIRRGEEPSSREQAAGAAEHYTERMKNVFREAGEQLESAGRQIADWLRGPGNGS